MLNRINDPDDLETVTPLECKAHPGYYIIPGHKNYVINRNGDVIRLSDGFSPKITIENTGYKAVRMKVGNHDTQLRIHRLLGMTFIGRPSRHMDKDHSKLQINHIDVDKLNNSLDNLEWCNELENTTHAYLNGRMDFNKKKTIAKDIRTGIETVFDSQADCEKAFDIKEGTLWSHLTTKQASRKTKNWHVFKKEETVGWPDIKEEDKIENSWDMVKVWYAHNPSLNKTVIVGSKLELVDAINAPYSNILKIINSKDFSTHLNGWFIEPRMEHITSESLLDIHKRVSLLGHSFRRIDLETGDVVIFTSLKEAAKSINSSYDRVSRSIFLKKDIGNYRFEAFKGDQKYFFTKRPYHDYTKGYEFFNEKEGIYKVTLINYKNETITIPKSLYVYSINTKNHIRHTQFLRHIDDDKTNDSFDNLKLMHKNDLVKKQTPHPDTLEVECTHCHKQFHQPYLDVVWRRKANKGGNFYCSYKCSALARAITNTLPEEEQFRIKELRESGKTIEEVTAITGYGANTIMKYQGSHIRLNAVSPEKVKQIQELAKTGLSNRKIGDKLNIGRQTVARYRN